MKSKTINLIANIIILLFLSIGSIGCVTSFLKSFTYIDFGLSLICCCGLIIYLVFIIKKYF